jgi:ubiquinol-cytochrome c reductase cytochrome b subunit
VRYDKWTWGVEPFKPNHMTYQALALLPVLGILVIMIVFFPHVFMLEQQPANTMTAPGDIKPEWYFLPSYQALKEVPEWVGKDLEELLGILVQMVFILAVILLPFLDRNPERHPVRRPVMMVIGVVVAIVVVGLGVKGYLAPPPAGPAGG